MTQDDLLSSYLSMKLHIHALEQNDILSLYLYEYM